MITSRHPTLLRTASALIALQSVAGCGEPLLATVGERWLDGSIHAPEDAELRTDARLPNELDAGSAEDAAEGFAPSADGFGNCVALPNLAMERAVDDAGLLQQFEANGVLTATDVHYNCADAGTFTDQIYSLRSGKPMLVAGTRYAVRTLNATMLGASFRGTHDACDRGQIGGIPDIWTGACVNVSAQQDAPFLRFAGTLIVLPPSYTFRLCDKPCP